MHALPGERLDRVPLALGEVQRLHDRRESAAADPVVDVVELVQAVCWALPRGPVPEDKTWEAKTGSQTTQETDGDMTSG